MLLPVFTAASTRKHPKEEKLWTSLVYGDGGEGESTLSWLTVPGTMHWNLILGQGMSHKAFFWKEPVSGPTLHVPVIIIIIIIFGK